MAHLCVQEMRRHMLCAMAALEDVSPAPLSDVFYGK